MRKKYPYLQNPYYENANLALDKQNFLSKIDSIINQRKYVKITLLDIHDNPLREIQGIVSTGNISLDGNSSVRRTCQFTAAFDAQSYDVENADMDFAINKKVFIEIGIKNDTDEWLDYPILWFPQGVYYIKGVSYNSTTTSAFNLSITLTDKMSKLNGDIGGKFPAVTILDKVTNQLSTGQVVEEKVLVYNIIQELVHHFGEEDLNNIVIEDVPLRIKRIMKWNGDKPLYIHYIGDNELEAFPSLTKIADNDEVYYVGDDCGYIYDDFVYDQDLEMNAGETITAALDKIKSYLGNYEYFYDVFGVFHFREIKNYLNTTQAKYITDDMKANDYLVETAIPKSVYSFTDTSNLISLNATPQYSNIKNDFIVQGLQKSQSSDKSYPIVYHLVIDTKPEVHHQYPTNDNEVLLAYIDFTGVQRLALPDMTGTLPEFMDFNTIYYDTDKDQYLMFDKSKDEWLSVEKVAEYRQPNELYETKDWRTEIYISGLYAKKLGLETNYYFEEINAFWPQIYDIVKQQFIGEEQTNVSDKARALTKGNHFIDMIDSSSSLGKFSVGAIGRRQQVDINDDVNCLFEPRIPDVVFIDYDTAYEDGTLSDQRDECTLNQEKFAQIPHNIYSAMITGGYHNAAYDEIKYQLFQYTSYQKTLSITALPVYYLEPNSRVTVADKVTQTYGNYMVNSLSLPLDVSSQMNCTLSECYEKNV